MSKDITSMAEMESNPKDSVSENKAKSPNILEQAKEEIEAVFPHDKSPRHDKETTKKDVDVKEENKVKSPNIIERAKEEIEAIFHHDKSPKHDKETHGRSDDIDEEISIDQIKAPGVFERVKEEFEAVVEAIHPKKESDTHDSPSK